MSGAVLVQREQEILHWSVVVAYSGQGIFWARHILSKAHSGQPFGKDIARKREIQAEMIGNARKYLLLEKFKVIKSAAGVLQLFRLSLKWYRRSQNWLLKAHLVVHNNSIPINGRRERDIPSDARCPLGCFTKCSAVSSKLISFSTIRFP